MKPKTVPHFETDEEAEAFLENDLSELDYSKLKPLSWELHPKTARINMRLSGELMAALKAKAAERGIPYQRLVREALEREVRR